MRTIALLISILSISTVAKSQDACAAPQPELVSVLSEELASLEVAQSADTNVQPGNEDWFLRRFWFRARAKAGVTLPGIFKIQATPELELLWERDLPQGWAGYKP